MFINQKILQKANELAYDHDVFPNELTDLPCIGHTQDADGVITDIWCFEDHEPQHID